MAGRGSFNNRVSTFTEPYISPINTSTSSTPYDSQDGHTPSIEFNTLVRGPTIQSNSFNFYPANVVTMSRDEVLDWDTAISLLEDFRVAMRYTIELGKIRARFNDAKLDFIYQFVAIRDVNHQIEDQLDQHQSRRVRRYATNSQATSGMSHLAIENADDSSGALVFQNNSYAGFNSHDTLPRFNSPPAINATTSFLPATPSSGRLSGNVGGNRKKGHFK